MPESGALNLSVSSGKDLVKATVHTPEAPGKNPAYTVGLSQTNNICAMEKNN